jgi:hypothetical protein
MAAIATMLYVVYHAPDTRLAFTAFFFVGLMFGMLRHSDMRARRARHVRTRAVSPS